jgi:methyl-accepting chemotaxis protein
LRFWASGSQQIVASVRDIDTISKETASQALAKLAQELQAAMARFQV